MSMTHNALLIQPTHVEPVTHGLTLHDLQHTVGGYIDAAFTVPSPLGNGRAITGYVHDEGLLMSLPVSALVAYPMGERAPLVGPLLVTGLDQTSGKTVPLTPDEIAWFYDRLHGATLLEADGPRIVPVIDVEFYESEAPRGLDDAEA